MTQPQTQQHEQHLQPVELQQAFKAIQELNRCIERVQHLGPVMLPRLMELHCLYLDSYNYWAAHAVEALMKGLAPKDATVSYTT